MPYPSYAAGCSNFRLAHRPTRREMLSIGGLTGMGLFLPELLQARALVKKPDRGTFGQAKSVIVLYLHGGHAQQETWDPKPNGPSPERGEFGAIATSVEGIRIGQLLPRSARLMHKLAVIRSLSHPNANHVQAALAAMTGHAHPPSEEARGDFPPSPHDFPPFGAVLSHLRPARQMPTWIQVGPVMRRANGTILHGQSPGLLGARHSALIVNQDLRATDVRVAAVSPRSEVPLLRLSGRRHLLEQVDRQRRDMDQAAEARTFGAYHERAFDLLTSSATARAFRLADEPAKIREEYGKTQVGQSCLLARRLAEAGVPMINVHFCQTPTGSWDTHGRHFPQMKNHLCPIFDQAFAALVADLDRRGLLDQTLVLATAEFGRTPKINSSGGRDHWPWVYSVAMAGGGTAGGTVYGSSDKIAAYPTACAHDPRDLAATVYHLLGIPASTWIHDQTRRPHALVIGKKIDGLLL